MNCSTQSMVAMTNRDLISVRLQTNGHRRLIFGLMPIDVTNGDENDMENVKYVVISPIPNLSGEQCILQNKTLAKLIIGYTRTKASAQLDEGYGRLSKAYRIICRIEKELESTNKIVSNGFLELTK